MKLKVEHTTRFTYDEPVHETATEVRLQPISNSSSGQSCLDFTLLVEPPASIFHYTDYFGNNVHHFNLLSRHKILEIKATSIVETGSGRTAAGPKDEILAVEFKGESRFVLFDSALKEFAANFQNLTDAFQKSEAICREINTGFIYEKGSTDTSSTSTEVMAQKRGVCQDFAHVMLAVCRCQDLPARYVSGYLYGGIDSEGYDRASHAWCEVFLGAEQGWAAFDPTHSSLLVNENYIKLGAGRDYADVTPVSGTYKGRAKENLEVIVRINSV